MSLLNLSDWLILFIVPVNQDVSINLVQLKLFYSMQKVFLTLQSMLKLTQSIIKSIKNIFKSFSVLRIILTSNIKQTYFIINILNCSYLQLE